MRNFLVLLCIIASTIILACTSNGNFGYPSKITFPKEGGTKIISGTSSIYNIDITNYNGEGKNEKYHGQDTLILTCQWLTIKRKQYDTKFVIIAEPNTTGKKRTLYIAAFVDDEFAEIKVEQ